MAARHPWPSYAASLLAAAAFHLSAYAGTPDAPYECLKDAECDHYVRSSLELLGYRLDERTGAFVDAGGNPLSEARMAELKASHDWRKEPLSAELAAALRAWGLQFDEKTGRIINPADGKPLARLHIAASQAADSKADPDAFYDFRTALLPEHVREQLKDLGYGLDDKRGWILEREGEMPMAVQERHPLTNARVKELFSPYDLSRQPISPQLRAGLQGLAYRMDDENGRILVPGSGMPLSRIEVAALQRHVERAQGVRTLERLHAMASERSRGGSVDPITTLELQDAVAGQRGAFPESLVRAIEGGSLLKKDITQAYAESTRFWDKHKGFPEHLITAMPAAGEPGRPRARTYFDEQERKFGEALAQDVSDRLSENPVGRELLRSLRDAQGRLRLPGFKILRTDSNDNSGDSKGGAFHDAGADAVIVNFSSLKRHLLEQAPPGERERLKKELAQPHMLVERLLNDPAARKRFVADYDALLVHELTHARQNRRDRVQQELSRGNLTGYPIEYEHEAYLAHMSYIHERLERDPAAVAGRPDQLQAYEHFIADLNGCLDGISRTYAAAGITDLSARDFARAQAGRARILLELAEADGLEAPRLFQRLKLLGMAHGSLALRDVDAGHERRMRRFAAGYESMRREGYELLSRHFQSAGRPDKALRFLTGKAVLMEADAGTGAKTPAEAEQARLETSRAARAAWDWLQAGHGRESLDDRLAAVSALEGYLHGRPAPPFTAPFARLSEDIYAEAAGEYLRRERGAESPAYRAAYLQAARAYAQRIADGAKKAGILRDLDAFGR